MQRIAIAPGQKTGNLITFNTDQTHYLYRVLRLRDSDRVSVFDGSGQLWVVGLQGNQGHILDNLTPNNELPAQVCLMVALTKGNGFEDVVRCCTELGVAEIMPVISDRCVAKPNPKRLDRWQRIATEAAEQSERVKIPIIHPLRSWSASLSEVQTYQVKLIASARYREKSLIAHLTSWANLGDQTIAIATGPEGGWTPTEIDHALTQNFQEVALGSRILRAVTAPIATMAVISNLLEA
ncbi:MAG: 16S rRNA (uracil(1498)-N(3))-methyltransferase [Synechococcaceae cyanobacterium RL_1_2]|nr:16S rRNA (uracil(1498)-N(3))-methyltransferase [Synechococcaceae cyanobacterium RL_1_2]